MTALDMQPLPVEITNHTDLLAQWLPTASSLVVSVQSAQAKFGEALEKGLSKLAPVRSDES